MNLSANIVIDTIIQCDHQAAEAIINGDMEKAQRLYAVGNNLYNKGMKQIPDFQKTMDDKFGKIQLVNLHLLNKTQWVWSLVYSNYDRI